MHPVSGGTQKVTFNKEDSREYESQLAAARAQADGNPYVGGFGMSNYQAPDAPGNAPPSEPEQSGSVAASASATTNPGQEQGFESDALSERLELMRRGGQKQGLNDHSETYGA